MIPCGMEPASDHSQDSVAALQVQLAEERAALDVKNAELAVANGLNYMLKRLAYFTRFLDGGRVCLSNNAAERAVRGVALGRKSWLFAGSDREGERAAAMYSLIYTCRLNDVDPQAYLAGVLARINGHPNLKIDQLPPSGHG